MKFLVLTLVLLAKIVVASVIKKCCPKFVWNFHAPGILHAFSALTRFYQISIVLNSCCSDSTPCHVSEPLVHPCHSCRPHKQSKFPPGLCETGWIYYQKTGACYKAFFEASFDNAEKTCNMKKAHLASIHSYEENHFVAELAKTGKQWTDPRDCIWIGLKQANYPENKNWIWTDGTKVDFLNFATNQPDNFGSNEHCTQMYNEHGSWPYLMWNDAPCTDVMRSFICKKARTSACRPPECLFSQ